MAASAAQFQHVFNRRLAAALCSLGRNCDPKIDLAVSGQPVNDCMWRLTTAQCKVCILSPLFSAHIPSKAAGHPREVNSILRIISLVILHGPTKLRRSASLLSWARVASFMSKYSALWTNHCWQYPGMYTAVLVTVALPNAYLECRIFRHPRSRTLKF
jgi:hypothetical protein